MMAIRSLSIRTADMSKNVGSIRKATASLKGPLRYRLRYVAAADLLVPGISGQLGRCCNLGS
jgi:hypothetical protein